MQPYAVALLKSGSRTFDLQLWTRVDDLHVAPRASDATNVGSGLDWSPGGSAQEAAYKGVEDDVDLGSGSAGI